MYCSVAQARSAGCTGTDAEVTAWIEAAMERITAYTRQQFEPLSMVVVGDVTPGGLVLLPRRVRSVSSVTPVADGADDAPPLPASAYRVTSSAVLGQVDAVRLAWGGYDDLVAGAESWAGGWAGLLVEYVQVLVEGEFGTATTPPTVVQGTALLAAHLQAQAAPSDADAEQDPALSVDDEGNNVAIEDTDSGGPSEPASAAATTGSTQVDALLVGHINAGAALIGGV